MNDPLPTLPAAIAEELDDELRELIYHARMANQRQVDECKLAIHAWAAKLLPRPVEDVDRDRLGREVREAWVRWARTQPNPKVSWLVPYDGLLESDKEADRQIGEHIASLFAITLAAERAARERAEARVAALEGGRGFAEGVGALVVTVPMTIVAPPQPSGDWTTEDMLWMQEASASLSFWDKPEEGIYDDPTTPEPSDEQGESTRPEIISGIPIVHPNRNDIIEP